jgi:hypothetical protein
MIHPVNADGISGDSEGKPQREKSIAYAEARLAPRLQARMQPRTI